MPITARQDESESDSPEDPATVVLVSIWTMASFATAFLAVRVYCKAFRTRGMWWDDYVLIAGWCVVLANSAIVSELMRVGFGMTLDIIPRNHTLTTAADTLNKISLGLTKTSFAVTLLRVAQGWHRWFIWTLVASMNALLLANCVTTWKPACGRPGDTYEVALPPPCWSVELMTLMAIISNGYSALVDFCLALLPWGILWKIQMKRHEKIGVAIGMSLGLIAGAIGVVKVFNVLTIADAPNIPYRLSIIYIWGQAEPNTTIVAVSIPVLRVLFRDMHKTGATSGDTAGDPSSYDRMRFPSASGHGEQVARSRNAYFGAADDDSERSIIGHESCKNSHFQTAVMSEDAEDSSRNKPEHQEGIELSTRGKCESKSDVGQAF